MQETRKGPFRLFLLENSGDIVVGVAGMNHQRQAGFPGRGDMGAEAGLLAVARTVIVVVVEAGLAEADDLRMAGQGDQRRRVGFGLPAGLVGMNADGAPDVVVCLGDGQDPWELADPGANGQHPAHPGRRGTPEHAVDILDKAGIVQVAVAIDQRHGQVAPSAIFPAASSTKRGKTPSGFGSGVPGTRGCAASIWAKVRRSAATAS